MEASRILATVETTGVGKAERELAGFGNTVDGVGGKAGKVLGGLVVAGAVAGGVAVAGLAGAALNAAAGFEQAMSNIGAVSGATTSEMEQISGLALQLGKDTSFSASSAAAGIEELIKGGVEIADVMGGAAESTLALAAAGGVDLATAAEIGANALAMFNLEGSDMAMVADQIAGAANASSLSVEDFKFSLAAAGSVLSSASQTFESSATAIALMGQAGIKGSDAGTSLKSMFNSLIPTTDKATGVMRDLGIITEDGANAFINANGTFKQTGEIAEVLQGALAGATDAQRALALETIFGSDGMRAGIVLTKAGAEGYNEMAGAMGKVTAESVAAGRLDNLRGDLEALGGSLETAGITATAVFLPALRGLTQGAIEAVNAAIPLLETWGPALIEGFQSAATIVTTYGLPALAGISAATAAYGLTLLPTTLSIGAMVVALQAKAIAMVATLGPFALVAAAAAGLVLGVQALSRSLQAHVDAQKLDNETMLEAARVQAALDVLQAPQSEALREVNAKLNEQIGIRDQLARKIELEARLGADSLPGFSAAQDARRAKLAEVEAQIDLTTAAVEREIGMTRTAQWAIEAQAYAVANGTVPAYIAYQGVLASTSEALGATGTAAQATQEQIDAASASITKAAEGGTQALGAWVTATVSFQGEMTSLSTTHWSTLAGLHKEWADATTDQERTAIQARIDAENTGFATSQTNAATAYAAEAGAQRAHLGQMLIETVNGWALMGTVPAERAAEMTNALATQYGVAESNTSLAFGNMIGTMLNWRDNAGVATADVITDLDATANKAVDTEQKAQALTGDYVMNLIENFNAGKINADELTKAVGNIPRDVSVQIHSNAGAVTASVDAASGALDRLAARANQTITIRANIDRPVLAQSPSPMETSLRNIADIIRTMPNLNIKATGIAQLKDMMSIGTPSKRFRDEVGVPMIQGTIEGVHASAGRLAEETKAAHLTALVGAIDAVKGARPEQHRAVAALVTDSITEWQRLRSEQWAVMEAAMGGTVDRMKGARPRMNAAIDEALVDVPKRVGAILPRMHAVADEVMSGTAARMGASRPRMNQAVDESLADVPHRMEAGLVKPTRGATEDAVAAVRGTRPAMHRAVQEVVTDVVTEWQRLRSEQWAVMEEAMGGTVDRMKGARPRMNAALDEALIDVPARMGAILPRMHAVTDELMSGTADRMKGGRPRMNAALDEALTDMPTRMGAVLPRMHAVADTVMDGTAARLGASRPRMNAAVDAALADLPKRMEAGMKAPMDDAYHHGSSVGDRYGAGIADAISRINIPNVWGGGGQGGSAGGGHRQPFIPTGPYTDGVTPNLPAPYIPTGPVVDGSRPNLPSGPDGRGGDKYGASTIVERQVVLNVSRPMNVENEFAGLDAWANAGRS